MAIITNSGSWFADSTVEELTGCLFEHGAAYTDVFCRRNGNATASDTAVTAPATASASVVASGSDSKGDDDNDNDSNDDKDGDDSSSTDAPNAAHGLQPDFVGYKSGLVIGALLFSATALGAFQI